MKFPVLWSGLVSRVGASHRVNLMHLSPLDRNAQEKLLWLWLWLWLSHSLWKFQSLICGEGGERVSMDTSKMTSMKNERWVVSPGHKLNNEQLQFMHLHVFMLSRWGGWGGGQAGHRRGIWRYKSARGRDIWSFVEFFWPTIITLEWGICSFLTQHDFPGARHLNGKTDLSSNPPPMPGLPPPPPPPPSSLTLIGALYFKLVKA